MRKDLRYYSEVDEIPIFNYYKAESDVRYLLLKFQDISESEKMFLSLVLFNLQDIFASKMDAISYKNNLNQLLSYMHYERKKAILLSIKTGLETLREDLRYCEVEERLPTLSDILNEWGVAIRTTVKDQIETLDREVKICINTINMLSKKNKAVETKTDWMKLVVVASKHWGSRIDPKVTTLGEWIEILKLIDNGRGN